MKEKHLCELCGKPMPEGEEIFKYHGYSCDCPKSSLEKTISVEIQSINFTDIEKIFEELRVKEFLEYQKVEQRNVVRFIAYSDGYRKALNDFMKEIKSKIAISNED